MILRNCKANHRNSARIPGTFASLMPPLNQRGEAYKGTRTRGHTLYPTYKGTHPLSYSYTHLADGAGVFQAKARLVTSTGQTWDFPHLRRRDARHADDSKGKVQDLHKAGAEDYFGVCAHDWQVKLRNTALDKLGSTKWAQATPCLVYSYPGPDLMAKATDSKCNIFVYHQQQEALLPAPLTRGGRWGFREGPPMAIDWWNDNTGRTDSHGRVIQSLPVPHWTRLPDPEMPQAGFIVAHPNLTSEPDSYSSHVGIVNYDGSWISAGRLKVNQYYHPKSVDNETATPYQPQNYRTLPSNN